MLDSLTADAFRLSLSGVVPATFFFARRLDPAPELPGPPKQPHLRASSSLPTSLPPKELQALPKHSPSRVAPSGYPKTISKTSFLAGSSPPPRDNTATTLPPLPRGLDVVIHGLDSVARVAGACHSHVPPTHTAAAQVKQGQLLASQTHSPTHSRTPFSPAEGGRGGRRAPGDWRTGDWRTRVVSARHRIRGAGAIDGAARSWASSDGRATSRRESASILQ